MSAEFNVFILQLQKLFNKNPWYTIVGSTTIVHVLLVLCACIGGRVFTQHITNSTTIPLIFALAPTQEVAQIKSIQQTSLQKKPELAQKKIQAKKKAAPVKKAEPKKIRKAPSIKSLAAKKPAPNKKQEIKKTQKQLESSKKQESTAKPQEQKAAQVVPKAEIKQTIKAQPEPVNQNRIIKPTEPVVSKETEQSLPTAFSMNAAGSTKTIADIATPTLYSRVCSAIGQHWHVPAGITAKTICKLLITLTPDGVVRNITLEQSSGITLYDIAAQAAARRAEYPRELWGKELSLHFH